jgi:hypothetical protein
VWNIIYLHTVCLSYSNFNPCTCQKRHADKKNSPDNCFSTNPPKLLSTPNKSNHGSQINTHMPRYETHWCSEPNITNIPTTPHLRPPSQKPVLLTHHDSSSRTSVGNKRNYYFNFSRSSVAFISNTYLSVVNWQAHFDANCCIIQAQ